MLPSPVKPRLYCHVPAPQVAMLSRFRANDYLDVNGWRYRAAGDGEPLVLLPGAFMTADMWFCVSRHLDGHRVLMPDSPLIQGVFDLRAVAVRLSSMLAAEGFDTADFVGISAGGGVLQHLLSTAPAMVRRAVLSHTGLLDPAGRGRIRHVLTLARLLP